MKREILFIVLLSMIFVSSCAQKGDLFDDVGDNIASPSAIWIDVATNRLYLVNSNSRVLYDWNQGNFQVYDISSPLAPVLIKSAETLSFSGEIYLDVASSIAYVPNRYTQDDQATEDRMYSFDIDESSFDDLLSDTESPLGKDSNAIACCYPANRAWVTTSLNEIQYVDLGGDMIPQSVSLITTMDDGSGFSNAEVYHIVVRDNQAFLSRFYGGVLIVNLDEVGVEGAVPVDYYINDIANPRGIAIDGDTLYVVGEGNEDGGWKQYVLVLDVSSLTPLTDNEFTEKLDKNNDGLLQALVQVGKQPQEIELSTDYAFVTNMQDDTVSVVNRQTMTNVATIGVGDEPFSLELYQTLAGDDQYMYIGNLSDNTLSIIDIPSLSVVATYP